MRFFDIWGIESSTFSMSENHIFLMDLGFGVIYILVGLYGGFFNAGFYTKPNVTPRVRPNPGFGLVVGRLRENVISNIADIFGGI